MPSPGFDVEREAAIAAGAITYTGWSTQEISDYLKPILTRCRDAAVKETEEADIKACCYWCENGMEPEYRPNGPGWWHPAGQTPVMGIGGPKAVKCDAEGIHERRRKREEQ